MIKKKHLSASYPDTVAGLCSDLQWDYGFLKVNYLMVRGALERFFKGHHRNEGNGWGFHYLSQPGYTPASVSTIYKLRSNLINAWKNSREL